MMFQTADAFNQLEDDEMIMSQKRMSRPNLDPAEQEMRVNNRVNRLQNWEVQRQASKCTYPSTAVRV